MRKKLLVILTGALLSMSLALGLCACGGSENGSGEGGGTNPPANTPQNPAGPANPTQEPVYTVSAGEWVQILTGTFNGSGNGKNMALDYDGERIAYDMDEKIAFFENDGDDDYYAYLDGYEYWYYKDDGGVYHRRKDDEPSTFEEYREGVYSEPDFTNLIARYTSFTYDAATHTYVADSIIAKRESEGHTYVKFKDGYLTEIRYADDEGNEEQCTFTYGSVSLTLPQVAE